MSGQGTNDGGIPGLDPESIQHWAGTWDDGGLWDDVAWLAGRFWATVEPESERIRAWHHLVLAVGNFKRQPGRRLRPASLSGLAGSPAGQPSSGLSAPGAEPAVLVRRADDPAGWQRLSDAIPGAAVATTTTLLAALWPDHHVIFDWRVHAAANGLRIVSGLDPTPGVTAESGEAAAETFAAYEIVRGWIEETASVTGESMRSIEQALYRLSQNAPSAEGRTWRGYGETLAAMVRLGG